MKKDIFEAQTVIATVDPKTGVVISRPPRDSGSIVDLNRRVYAKLDRVFFEKIQEEEKARRARESSSSVSEPNVPVETTRIVAVPSDVASEGGQGRIRQDDSSSAAITVLWQDKSVHSPSLYLAQIAGYMRDPKNRRLLLWLLIAATILLFVIVARRSSRGPGFEMMQSAAAEAVPAAKPSAERNDFKNKMSESSIASSFSVELNRAADLPNGAVNVEDEAPTPVVRLKDAVFALTEGRIQDAVAQYTVLAKQTPEEASYRLILQILETDAEKRK